MKIRRMGLKKSIKATMLISILASLMSCGIITEAEYKRLDNQIIDTDIGMTREDFKNKLLPPRPVKDARKSRRTSNQSTADNENFIPGSNIEVPAIPSASNILAAPKEPEPLPDKLISLAVTDDVPLKDVLVEISRLADVDMEIDPRITGGVILRVKDKPFKDVIARVVDLGGLRYKVKNGIVRVERDTPYEHNYKVDYLNVKKSSTSGINIDTQGLGGSDAKLPSGSTSTTTQTTDDDVWESVEQAIKNILAFTPESNITTGDGTTTVAAASTSTIQMNKQAGVLSIIATEHQHNRIEDYLEQVEGQISSQVLIEAKVIEVSLDDQYKSGIDWGTLRDQKIGVSVSGNFKGGISSTADFFTIKGYTGKNLTSAVSLTEKFGTSRTISSPRLHAMNNQQAVLSFAENSVYFKLTAEQTTDTNGAIETKTITVDSELKTVPVGVILAILPSINRTTREITMHVRPTLSRITDTVNDPGVDIIVATQTSSEPINVTSAIPVVEVREMDSVLKIRSGDIMVIGGLMKDEQTNEDQGVPYLNKTPLIGNMFKSKVKKTKTVETVIFIKASIVDEDRNKVDQSDQDYYNNFAPKDPRPLAF